MSDKLTDLTTTATAADADLLYIVDVDDPTDDPSGTSKAIAASDLLPAVPAVLDDLGDVDTTTTAPVLNDVLEYDGTNFVPAAPSGGGATAIDDLTDVDTTTVAPVVDDALVWDGTNWVPGAVAGGGGGETTLVYTPVLIEEQIDPVSGYFEFLNIPQDYDYIEVQIDGNTTSVSDLGVLRYEINGDTTATNYHFQQQQASNGGSNTGELPDNTLGYLGGTQNTGVGSLVSRFGDYNKAKYQTATSRLSVVRSASHVFTGILSTVKHNTQAAITSLKILCPTGNITGSCRLVGYKEQAIGGGGTPGPITTVTTTELGRVSGSDVATLDISGLDVSGYDRIYAVASVRSHEAVVASSLQMLVNNDTTASNYNFVFCAANSTDAFEADGPLPDIAYIPGASAAAGLYSQVTIRQENPNAGYIQTFEGDFAAPSPANLVNHYIGKSIMSHDSATAAVNQLTFRSDVGNISGRVIVYGVKEETLSAATGGSGGGSLELIEAIELSAEGEFDFTGIPAGFDRLVLKGSIDAPTGGAVPYAYCYLNENTTLTNYQCALHQVFNGSNSVAQLANPTVCYLGGSTAASQSHLCIEIEDYDGSLKKHYRATSGSQYSASSSVSSQMSLVCNELAPITRLRVTNPTANGLVGKLYLYGEKSVVSSGTPSGGLWTPAETDTVGWFDAADTDSLVLDGTNVISWKDKSGKDFHAYQSITANRPVYDSVNKHLDFDGVSDNMKTAGQPINGGIPRSVFTVVSADTYGSAGGGYFSLVNTADGTGKAWDLCIESDAYYIRVGGNDSFGTGLALSTDHILNAEWAATASQDAVVYNNGTAIARTGGASASSIETSRQSYMWLGATPGQTDDYFDGKIKEVVIFNRVVTQAEREIVEGYLAWKWGLEANLPSGHPYENAAPVA